MNNQTPRVLAIKYIPASIINATNVTNSTFFIPSSMFSPQINYVISEKKREHKVFKTSNTYTSYPIKSSYIGVFVLNSNTQKSLIDYSLSNFSLEVLE